jgi:hypothetical protein
MDIKQEDLIRFWTWCGLNYAQWIPRVPEPDLNNLYQYAIPKLQDKGYMIELTAYDNVGFYGEIGFEAIIKHPNYKGNLFDEEADNPTEALYKAIMEVIKNEQ